MGNGAKRKRERERERVLYDRVRGMRKTQKVEPCVFPREEEGMDVAPSPPPPLAKCAAATLFSRSKG